MYDCPWQNVRGTEGCRLRRCKGDPKTRKAGLEAEQCRFGCHRRRCDIMWLRLTSLILAIVAIVALKFLRFPILSYAWQELCLWSYTALIEGHVYSLSESCKIIRREKSQFYSILNEESWGVCLCERVPFNDIPWSELYFSQIQLRHGIPFHSQYSKWYEKTAGNGTLKG